MEAKRRCTLREFERWVEYERIEPFGDYWLIQQGAVLTSRVMNTTKNKNSRSYKPSDFLPPQKRGRKKMAAKEMQLQLRMFAESHNRRLRPEDNAH